MLTLQHGETQHITKYQHDTTTHTQHITRRQHHMATHIGIDMFNHFSTTGRNCGMPLRDACVRQAVSAAIATSSFKIFLTLIFPRRGATCYILPWRAMSRIFNGVNFGYRSADVYRSFHTFLRVIVRIRYFHNGERFDALCFRHFR